ncbi:hypothetical protein [Kineosporia succinea]|uniref:NADH:ubiquinone oxidoreductase subunit 6 (Subunit J) n=1 Tax=Kineosporia succinea TaxID=84632 RepID=A0ABT9PCP5_9ACTN|nr:hypothetical protein [Kineosporia succinea]MDP9830486.1 NADH:ubiquinone oxidoreductase subunit 6 (subunit J) [Kineosporia succinea]
MSEVFLTSLILAGLLCLMWRTVLYVLLLMGVTALCMAVVFMAVGIQSISTSAT